MTIHPENLAVKLLECVHLAFSRLSLAAIIGNDNGDQSHAVFLTVHVKNKNVFTVVWLVRATDGSDLHLGTEAAIQVWRVLRAIPDSVDQGIGKDDVLPMVIAGIIMVGGPLNLAYLRDMPVALSFLIGQRCTTGK